MQNNYLKRLKSSKSLFNQVLNKIVTERFFVVKKIKE